jgi:hypothetical protein
MQNTAEGLKPKAKSKYKIQLRATNRRGKQELET